MQNNLCTLNPDKFGFYQVGNLRTYSKLEAFELQRRTGHFPEWNFNREVFALQNWTQEPGLDLWTLYKSRAQQIRDSYDYVVLLYSGGSDSQNILSAWLEQGCRIDEIATQWNYSGVQNQMSYWNGEVTKVALPWIEKLQNRGIKFKFRLIDISQDTLDIIDFLKDNYQYYSNCNMSPNNYAKNLWRTRIPEYQNLIAQGKKLCFVWGSDKPFFYWDKKYYILFQDMLDNCVNSYTQSQYHSGWYDELFYWTPDLPEIDIKQAHVLRRFVETIHDLAFYSHKKTRYGYNQILKMWLTEEAVKIILYPHWDQTTYTDGKSKTTITSMRDKWLIDSNLDQAKIYTDIVQDLNTRIDPNWLNSDTIIDGIKGCISPRYYIE